MKCKNCSRDVWIYLPGGFCSEPCASHYPIKVVTQIVLIIAIIAFFVRFSG